MVLSDTSPDCLIILNLSRIALQPTSFPASMDANDAPCFRPCPCVCCGGRLLLAENIPHRILLVKVLCCDCFILNLKQNDRRVLIS